MTWRILSKDRFEELRSDWDSLNQANGGQILLDSCFVWWLLRCFATPNVLLAVSRDAGSPGMALVESVGGGRWRTFHPSQAPLGLLVMGTTPDPATHAKRLLRSLPGYPLTLSVLHQDPDHIARGFFGDMPDVETVTHMDTARLVVKGTFAEYWKHRSRNLVHNLSRQRRRLVERGHSLKFRVEREAGAVARGIDEYGWLEARGWKAENGTAVTAGNSQGRFYRGVLEEFCERKEGVIYCLLLDEQLIAVDLCLERNGMLAILKTAYDEQAATASSISPGLLIHEEIFRSVFEEGRIHSVEFYGRVQDWHRKWTAETRTMYHVNIYRSAWIRRIRGWLKRHGFPGTFQSYRDVRGNGAKGPNPIIG
jgi:hypothetical protein